MNGLARQLRHVWSLDPSAMAVEFERRATSWGDIGRTATALDELLTARGLGPGAAIGLFLRNRPSVIAAIVGLLASGRCIVSLNPHHPQAALAAELRDLNLAAAIGDEVEWTDGVKAAAAERGTLGIRLLADAQGVATVAGLDNVGPGEHRTVPEGIALEVLTSGTTGKPKRVTARYKALADAVLPPDAGAGGVSPAKLRQGAALMVNPLVHVSGIFGVLHPFCEGRAVVLLDKFDVEKWTDAIERHKMRFASLLPTPMRMVLDAGVAKERLASLTAVRTGTAPLPVETQREFEERYGVPVLVQYSATEFLGGVAGWTLEDHRKYMPAKLGSIGRAHPGILLQIADPDTGATLPPGETGLLEVRSDKRFGADGKWIRTTDLAWLDADGFLYIVGRADDVIIRGGLKVNLPAVTDLVRGHPAVRDAICLGIPDKRLGQVPVCAVETYDNATVTAADLAQFCRERLAAYQVPVTFRIVRALPRTVSHKVDRVAARALFEERAAGAA
jgi:acyl-CoA synthetase (AMP-forming)/AMP-acid ligase II